MAKPPQDTHQTPLGEENEHAEVYSVSQDHDGKLHFSRRDFLLFGMAVGGTLLVKGVCPRFGEGSASTKVQPVQARMMPLPKVYLHAKPSIDSNIVDSLQQNDIVLLIEDHPELGWVEAATRAGQRGWLKRNFVDFSRAITSRSPNFGLSGSLTPTPTKDHTPIAHSIQLSGKAIHQKKAFKANQVQSSGEVIQNGDFEAGHVFWVEESNHGTDVLITNTWADPYQGSYVALLGGVDNAVDKLTQLFHVPADVQDSQTLNFYLKVTTEETSTTTAYDTLVLRFLDTGGTPISADIPIADSTAPMDWLYWSVQLKGLTSFADQDIQIQFEGDTDFSNITNFVIDLVSLNMTYGTDTPTPTQTETPTETPTEAPTAGYYIYLPIILNGFPPAPTNTPTETPTPTETSTSGPCSCNTAPCSCNSNPCSCNAGLPCSCNSYPTGPTATFCVCNSFPCACNSLPTCSCNAICTCNSFPCACNSLPTCSCNAICTCNSFPCACNSLPTCSCNAICTCNSFPCACNSLPTCSCNTICTCNSFPCAIT